MTPGTLIRAVNSSTSARRIDKRWDSGLLCTDAKSTKTVEPDHCLRAWITAIAASMVLRELQVNQPLSTRFLDRAMLQCFVALATRSIRLDLLKPLIQETEFTAIQLAEDGSLVINNARFKTRVRRSKTTYLRIYLENGDVVTAEAKHPDGRRTPASAARALTDKIACMQVIGREEATSAEKARYHFLRFSLTNSRTLPSFVKIIWFPGKNKRVHHNRRAKPSSLKASHLPEGLNSSQREVATAMLSLSPRDSLVIAHGAASRDRKDDDYCAVASTWVDHGLSGWIVAQSNVGVKNIAETLFKKNVKFKLIVSKEFLFEWHEELYSAIEDVVIRTDNIPERVQDVATLFGGITLVLCTLSSLSNPKLDECGLLDLIPMRSLVVDEASQIDVFEFMHLFYKFSDVLMKVCFFGDPKQLPPYGAEEAGLETIFDVKHLNKMSYFLNTQCKKWRQIIVSQFL
ncbi:hypothetical protein BJV78DRAFT_1282728 [Lactifluus subvellereus]|nr:hypothetical protein BJV78DRAFT_1282728 [Lactifluus subvellereus]